MLKSQPKMWAGNTIPSSGLSVHCTALSAFRCCAVVTRSRVTYNQCHNPSGAHSFGILIIVKGLHKAKSGFRTA